MELRHLRYFVAVAEAESVTKAAIRLHLSQPPLSRQIRDLEEELGVTLFHRTARSLRLTPAGRAFLADARAVLVAADEAIARVRASAGGPRTIEVGYAPTLTAHFLPRALDEFRRLHAPARVRLHDYSTAEMLAGLAGGQLDLTLQSPPEDAPRSLVFEPLAEFALRAVLPACHALAGRRQLAPRDLAGEKFLIYSRDDYPEYAGRLGRFFAAHRVPFRIDAEFDGAASLIAGVQSGGGIALLPECSSLEHTSGLVVRPVRPSPPRVVLALGFRPDALRPLAAAFAAIVRDVVRP